MARTLFMASEDDLNVLLLMKRVENLQNDTARKRKNGLHTFPLEAFNEDLSTCELHDGTSIHPASGQQAEESAQYTTLQFSLIEQTRIPR